MHIAAAQAWNGALARCEYRTADLESTGFIHLCTPDQLPFVLAKFFPTRAGFVVLHIDAARLTAPVVYESSEPGMAPFPHLYGPLNVDAVVTVQALEPAP
ncbi:MAG: DUF952 domain-containing protein [Bryobacterales bacterium]|nr:DUF952 domain-containing protein [Bryobacterales bacterium]